MLETARDTAFTVSELLRKNQWNGKIIPPTQIRISKRIVLTKSNNSKELIVCHYFINRFQFQNSVCDVCHDLTM